MTKEKSGLYGITAVVLLSALLAGAVAAPVFSFTMKEYPDTDLQGSDYSTAAAPAKEDCAMACMVDTRCKAATWVHTVNEAPSCRLKDAVPPKTPFSGDTTRVIHSYIKEEIASGPTQPPDCPAIAPPDFTVDPMAGTFPLTVHVADKSAGISSVVWDYGDGSTITGGQHSDHYHTYPAAGRYFITLTIFDACGFSSSKTKEVFVNGPEAAGYGNLRVDTTPAGAMLYIDGYPAGTTPAEVTNLTAGVHRIRITLAGYNDYGEDLPVSPGQQIDMRVALTKSLPGGGIPYTYLPAATTGASAYTAPDSSLKNALKGPAVTLTATGGRMPGTGTLTVSSNPAGANVYLDGKNEGKTPLTIPDVAAGQHSLLLTLQGYTDASRAVDISGGADNQVAVDLAAAKKTPGFEATAGLLSVLLLVLLKKNNS